jgi:Malectin domain
MKHSELRIPLAAFATLLVVDIGCASETGEPTDETSGSQSSASTSGSHSHGGNGSRRSATYIHAGGGAYTDSVGNLWSADMDFNGGVVATPVTHAISGSPDAALYQTERYGASSNGAASFHYSIPVENGNYTVLLKFSEDYFAAAGQRQFDVTINNEQVLANFDIYAAAGGQYTAIDEQFNVTVTSGLVNVTFTPGSVNNPKIDSLAILPEQPSTSNPPPGMGTGTGTGTGTGRDGGSSSEAGGGQPTSEDGSSAEAAKAALATAIFQNTPGNSVGAPAGVPSDYSWYGGKSGTNGLADAPAGFSAFTGWGIIYPNVGEPNVSCNVYIDGFEAYEHLTTGAWVLAQSQTADSIEGAHYIADFSNNASEPWTEESVAGGGVEVDSPPTGYNNHYYPGARGTYTPGTVNGLFVKVKLKTDNASANLVAALGADWWLSATAAYDNMETNPGVGQSNFILLTTQYQTLYFTSLTPAQLTADPPPLP